MEGLPPIFNAKLGFKVVSLRRRKPFRHANISTETATGVYIIWWRKICLYVGKAERQTVGDRMLQHWNECHNIELRTWIEAKRSDLEYCCASVNKIGRSEKHLIRVLRPRTNVLMNTGG